MPKITLDNYQQYLLRDKDGKVSTIGVPSTVDELSKAKRTPDEPLQRNPLVRGAASAVKAFTAPAQLPVNLAKMATNAFVKDDAKREDILRDIDRKNPLAMMPVIREPETGGEKAADIIGSLIGNVASAYTMGVGGGATALGAKAAGGVAAKTGSQALGKIAGGAVDDILLGLPLNVTQGIVAGDGDAGKTLKEIALGVGIDAASGGLLGGASHGLSKLADSKAAKSGLKTATQTLDEIDEAYKTVAETAAKNAQLDEVLGPQDALTARPDFLDDLRAGMRADGLTESERDLLQGLARAQSPDQMKNFIDIMGDSGPNGDIRRIIYRLSSGESININEINALPRIRELTEDSANRPETYDINTPERVAIRQEISDKLYAMGSATVDGNGKTVYNGVVDQGKRADIVIGLPAAGKSSVLVDPLSRQHHSRVIDSDMAKLELPEYDNGMGANAVHRESQDIIADLLERATFNGDNIVYPIVGGGDPEKLIRKIQDLRAEGYSVYLHLNELPNGKAIGRALNRYVEEGRYLSPALVYGYGDTPTQNFEKIIQTEGLIDGYSRYSNDVARGESPKLIQASPDYQLPASGGRGRLELSESSPSGASSSRAIGLAGDDHRGTAGIPSEAQRNAIASNYESLSHAPDSAEAGFVVGKNATSTGSTVEEVVADLGDAEAFHRGYMALNAPDMTPRITVNGKEWATDDYVRAVQQRLPDDPEQLRAVVSQLEDAQAEQIAQAIRVGADEDAITSLPVNIQLFAAKEKLDYLELDAGEVGSKTRKFMEIRVPGRDNYTDKELADIVAGRSETYNPKSNEDLVKKAQKRLQENKYRKQITSRVMSFDSADLFNDEEIAAVQLLMQEAERNGDFELAANLRQGLSRKLTEAGRSVQAASLLGRLTPEETLRSAENLMRKQADRKMYAGADEDLDDLARQLTRKLQAVSDQPNLDKASMGELVDETVKRLDSNPYITGAEIKKQLVDTIETLGSRKQQLAKYLRRADLDTLADRIATVVNNGDLNDVTMRRVFEDVLELPRLSEDEVKEIVKLVNAINGVDDHTLEKEELMEQLYTLLANKQILTFGEKFSSMRKLFMLSNIKTHLRNIFSNFAMSGLRKADDLSASIIEKVFVKDPEQLTRAIGWRWSQHGQNIMETVNKSTDRAVMKMRHVGKYEMGTNSVLSQYRRHFNGKVLNRVDKLNGNLLEGEDVFFFKRAYKDSLGQIMTARGLSEITEKIEKEAMDRALQAVFRTEDLFLVKLGGKAKALMSSSKRGEKIAGQIADIIIPFTKTPANIAQQTVQYSPLGLVQACFDLVMKGAGKSGKQTADIVNEFAKGISGSTLLVVGVLLGRKGVINTGYGKNAKERAADELAGVQENSVQFGDTSITIDWLQPVSAPLIAGAVIGQQAAEDDVDLGVIFGAGLESVDSVLDLTMLQSLYDFFGGYDAGAIGSISSVAENAISQMIPTTVGQLARAIDPVQRKPSGESVVTDLLGDNGFSKAIQQVMAKVPFVTMMLEPETDAWGDEVYRTGKATDGNAWVNAFQQILSPANIKTATGDDVISKLILALYEDQGSRTIPSEPTREKADELEMNYSELAKLVGKVNRQAVEDLTADKVRYTVQRENAYGKKKNVDLYWSDMTADERARVLSRIYTETKKQVEEPDDDYFEQLIRAVQGG